LTDQFHFGAIMEARRRRSKRLLGNGGASMEQDENIDPAPPEAPLGKPRARAAECPASRSRSAVPSNSSALTTRQHAGGTSVCDDSNDESDASASEQHDGVRRRDVPLEAVNTTVLYHSADRPEKVIYVP